MPVYSYRGVRPRLGEGVFLAPTAVVAGDVEVGDDVSFRFHSVARGDVNTIRIGARSNIQDHVVLHVTHERYPLTIGNEVVVAHGAILHGCTIEDGALGVPARVVRPLEKVEQDEIREISRRYLAVKKNYEEELGPGW